MQKKQNKKVRHKYLYINIFKKKKKNSFANSLKFLISSFFFFNYVNKEN